jgi:hypothetical protein
LVTPATWAAIDSASLVEAWLDTVPERVTSPDGRGGDQVILQLAGSIQIMHYVHFNLSVRTLAGRLGRDRVCVWSLSERNCAGQGNQPGPHQNLGNDSIQQGSIHLHVSPLPEARFQRSIHATWFERALEGAASAS